MTKDTRDLVLCCQSWRRCSSVATWSVTVCGETFTEWYWLKGSSTPPMTDRHVVSPVMGVFRARSGRVLHGVAKGSWRWNTAYVWERVAVETIRTPIGSGQASWS